MTQVQRSTNRAGVPFLGWLRARSLTSFVQGLAERCTLRAGHKLFVDPIPASAHPYLLIDQAPLRPLPRQAARELLIIAKDTDQDLALNIIFFLYATTKAAPDMVWADLPLEKLQIICDTFDPTEKLRRLCHAFEIKEYCNDPWTVILVDFLYYNLLFCEEQNFSPEQTSTFFSIMKCVFDFTFRQAGHDGNGADVAGIKESFNFFRSKMIEHSVEAVDHSPVGPFSVEEIELVAAFASKTFYRQFNAYKYCFVHQQPVELLEDAIVVETPLDPPPLAHGTLR